MTPVPSPGSDFPLHALDPNLSGLVSLPPPSATGAVTSTDRTGGNDDGFSGTYSFLDREGTDYVIFDEAGPGIVVRMWMDGVYALLEKPPPGRIRFTFDGASSPQIDLPAAALFEGSTFPFLFPLVGDGLRSSGGFYCYVPLPYRKSLKIVTDQKPYFLHIWFQRYPKGTDIRSFDGDRGLERAVEERAAAWADPHTEDMPTPAPGAEVEEGRISVAPGARADLARVHGGGTVRDLRLWIPGAPLPAGLWLSASWESTQPPAVEAPLPDLFGCGLARAEVRALPAGMTADPAGAFYLRWPMPFRRAARISIENRGPRPAALSYRIWIDVTPPAPDAGYFHALSRSGSTTQGLDWTFLETSGPGRWVGLVLTMTGPETRSYLEGDEKIYVDGSTAPVIWGTGTEDFFNSGWYFQHGPYSLPLHGNPAHQAGDPDRTCAYRYLLADAVSFQSQLKAGIEHGPVDDVPATYSSVAEWYDVRP